MNQKEFEKKVRSLISTSRVDLEFLIKWYAKTLEQLESLKEQTAVIDHPRYRGDERESDFRNILKKILPESISIAKGFAINEYATKSLEQDCLLLDRHCAATFVKTGSTVYYPIESVLGSVEIKSKLTLSELRKIIINCMSLKKLLKSETPKVRIAYFVFAYNSVWKIEKAACKINELNQEIETIKNSIEKIK